MVELTDARVEEALRELLRSEAATVPLTVTREDVVRRARIRGMARARRPRLVLFAAALLVPVSIAAGIIALAPPDEPRYRAVIVRGLEPATQGAEPSDLEVVLARPDGRVDAEVVVPASRLAGWASASYPKLSPSGRWLAFGLSAAQDSDEATAIVDLHAPDADARILPGAGLIGWGPDDTLWRAPNGPLEHIDPVTGAIVTIALPENSDLAAWPWPSWGLPVVADGSGAVLIDPSSLGLADGRFPGNLRWAQLGEDGSVRDGHGLPDLAPAVGPRTASADKGVLQVCDSDPAASAYCHDLPRGAVLSYWSEGIPTRTWRAGGPADEFVLGASWAADGGIWLLVDRRDGGRRLGLVRLGADGGESDWPGFAVSPSVSVGLAGLAPDDSTVAIDWDEDSDRQTALVDRASGRSYLHQGQFAGFVRPGIADAWASQDVNGADGRLLAVSPSLGDRGYSPLMSLEEQVGLILDAERLLLTHEAEATPDGSSAPATVTLGPIELGTGYGISLVCSGPGDVSIARHDALDDPVVTHCEDGTPYGEAAPGVTETSITVTVTADTATAWRLVVYDPPPGRYSPSPGASPDAVDGP